MDVIKKIITLLMFCMLVGCSGITDKIRNSSFETAVYPATLLQTRICLDSAARNNNLFLDDAGHLPGGEQRFTLSRERNNPLINLDMTEYRGKTHIDYIIDRREKKSAMDLDAVLDYCKRHLR